MTNDFITVSRELVKRGWTDFEPKIIVGLLSGSIAAVIISIATQYGLKLDAPTQHAIVVGLYFLGGYLAPSSGTKVVTSHVVKGEVEQQTKAFTGNVKVTTQSTPVQQGSAPYTPPVQNPDPLPPLPPRPLSIAEMVQQSPANTRMNDRTQVLP